MGAGGGAAKWVLNKLEASEAITLAQPSQHLAGLCPSILPLYTPGAHTPIVAAKYPSALWDAVSGQLPTPEYLLDELIQTYLLLWLHCLTPLIASSALQPPILVF